MNLPPSLGEFLTFVGTAAFIGFVLTWVAGNSTWFEKQSTNIKMLVLLIVAIGMGLGSQALVTYVPAGVVTGLEPWYKVVVASIAILLSSQTWHEIVHKNGTPAAAALASG